MAGYIGTKSVLLSTTAANVGGDMTVGGDATVIGSVTAASFVGSGASLTGLPAPFVATTVTGTTPSLDVGTYNYFDNGTLSGDATISFVNVPTEARWTYVFEVGTPPAYDLTVGTYIQSFDVSTQDPYPQDVFFIPDGTKMYVTGVVNGIVIEYSLSTPWDISTASFVSSLDVSTQTFSPSGLYIRDDGVKLYILGADSLLIHEYTLSTPWSVSTASHVQNFNVATQDQFPFGIYLKPDGTKAYITGIIGLNLIEYSLSTPWDISTASFVQNFSIATEDSSPYSIFFKPDGTRVFVVGGADGEINEYSLSTPWDISTASFVQNFSVATQDPYPFGIFIKPDGTEMFVLGGGNPILYKYSIAAGNVLTLPSSIENPPAGSYGIGNKVAYEFVTLDGGTTVRLINEGVL